MRQPKLLLVEDDKSLGATLQERLQKEGYNIIWTDTILKSKQKLAQNNFDLILLDVGLPDGSGFTLASELTKQSQHHPPFLFLTAQADAPNRLKGFELGAEEFIPKPFHLKELLLRVKHVLDAHRHIHDALKKKVYFKGYVIDFESYRITNSFKEEIQLSVRDSELLYLLISERHRAVSRDEILDKLWGEDSFPTNRTIDNSIVRLRQAFGEDGQEVIESIRGVGYRWLGAIGETNG